MSYKAKIKRIMAREDPEEYEETFDLFSDEDEE